MAREAQSQPQPQAWVSPVAGRRAAPDVPAMAAGAPVLGGPVHIVSVTLGRVVAHEGRMQIHD
jgi:hypothetical protein